ncbi:MAG: UvrD-helicase domain-containing protein [Clostridiales bacterium]|nr:UvrD-helicase domain-containing protein [Clostridiales bacterium]
MSEQKVPLALAFPLRGSQLIEASAGTGKTFTISALYTVLNQRLMAHRPTIISTNLAMEEMERRYSPQIISRIRGAYTCFRFYGQDIRQMQKK